MNADEPRKGRVNSRSKGRSFEQHIARLFRAWLGDGWTVKRNPTDWQHGQVEKKAGEFTIEGPIEFPYCIECKAHESFDYGQLWTGTGPFRGFWEQAVAQADVAGKEPMLIFKRNLGPILVAIPQVPRLVEMTMTQPPVEMQLYMHGVRLVVMTLDRFLSFRHEIALTR